MGLDFDVFEFCRKLRLEKPPFMCPVEKCGKTYTSTCGMQYHLVNYDHDNPQPLTPSLRPARKKGRSRPAVATADLTITTPKEPLTYAESQKIVQFEIDGKVARISISDTIEAISFDDSDQRTGTTFAPVEAAPEPVVKLPEPSFRVLPDYNICDAPVRPNAYIRFIEKSAEELDGEVEYDVDEEDTAWLGIMNDRRRNQGLPAVSVDSLELLMDRLEKESFFQAAQTGQGSGVVDDDAVCCICMDGECQNTNVILFCDMCNLAVHQDCYGVPYIPEGQWLCRRCLQSPSRPVDCVLCPNTGGAFKQTDRGHWAHVVCALWIPEVRFANTVFLEPIDSIESIPPARWKLSCYVCKQRGVGACIQCHRNNCYAAFHVTCAQHAGLYMRMDTVNRETEGQPVMVQKTAFCDAHTPHGAQDQADRGNKAREESRMKMKQARRLLAKKRTSVPVILIPTIPPEKVQEIASLVSIPKKPQFIQRLIAYWTLKRHYRNGVPLLRRLQSQGSGSGRAVTDSVSDTNELLRQHKYWQCLRQDLERARLLCELVRKREKLKAAQIRIKERCLIYEINPLEASMEKLLDLLQAKDTAQIFIEPVDPTEVPDYSSVVTHPMDLSTMKCKLESGQYPSIDVMEDDFNLMIANCLAYNSRDTVFYRHGVRMRDQGTLLFKSARKELESLGIIQSEAEKLLSPPMQVEKSAVQEKKNSGKGDTVAKDIDSEYQEIMNEVPIDKRQTRLEMLLEKAKGLKHGIAKNKRLKTIREEIKKFQQTANTQSVTDSSQSDGELDESVSESIASISTKKTTSSSPSGINRRDAVLFSRKMQAALKKSSGASAEETGDNDLEGETAADNVNGKTSKDISAEVDIPSKSSGKRGRRSKGNSSRNQSKDLSDGKRKPVSESFLVYRGMQEEEVTESESESGSFRCSTSCTESDLSTDSQNHICSIHGLSGSDDRDVDTDQDEDEARDQDMNNDDEDVDQSKPSLEPLQLVWAKCRGYPWYPALIIDPETPRGFVYNGVPLPAPPSDVLALRKNIPEPELFLVLFFDAKRTWQWLPPKKLELLGLQKSLDQSKLVESRKPADRKAVKKAYQDALLYQSQVTDAQGPGAIM